MNATTAGLMFSRLATLASAQANAWMESESGGSVHKAGKYPFEIRSLRRHTGTCAGAADDPCNDVYTKVNGSAFFKTLARAPWEQRGWSDGVSPGGTIINKRQHELKAGTNTLSLGARSLGIAIDAVRIYLVGAGAGKGAL